MIESGRPAAYMKSRLRRLVSAATSHLAGATVGTQNRATREAWLEPTLAAIPAGSRILDAGAGEQQYRRFCTHLSYVSQDFGQYDGIGDGIGRQTGLWDQTHLDIVCDIAAIPEPSNSFDAIMCIEVLEHIPHPVDALRELARLLRPGGKLILSAPFDSLTHFAPYYFQTGYSRYFYEHWLTELGFEIIDMQWNGNYFEFLAQELRRLPKVSTQYTGKMPSLMERISIRLVLRALEQFSNHDRGSEQLLSFGLQVVARKRIDQSTE